MTQTAVKVYYRPGLVFKAHEKAKGHSECCRSELPELRNGDGSIQREKRRALWAEFGVFGDEYVWEDTKTGETGVSFDFRGGFFDLDAQAEQNGWDPEEKEQVARHMTRMAESGKAKFSLYSAPKFAAPWPTYDETHHSKIVDLASTLGLLGESLNYEEQNKKRPTVVDGLRAAIAAATESTDDDLTVSV